MQDRPSAAELLHAATEFCDRDLIPQLSGRLRFHARVLRNVLSILGREWEQEEDALRREWERLRDLLGEARERPESLQALRDAVRDSNAELAVRIRSGEMDERFDETVAAVYETVVEKLRIANPAYASSET